MKTYRIDQAKNGWILFENDPTIRHGMVEAPYVFNSASELGDWIKRNLDKQEVRDEKQTSGS